MVFIFDLDGTLTEVETLPRIAQHFGVEAEIRQLTEQTVMGNIPFMESFIKRVEILGRLDVHNVAQLLMKTPLNSKLQDFISKNSDICRIATGNYRGWVSSLAEKIGCKFYASEGQVDASGQLRLTSILRKENLVYQYKARGESVVFIGDGHNDAEAMRAADISIACGIVHQPANSVLQVADYVVYDSSALVRLLEQIKKPQKGASVVISAAGIGSRLGLGQTKSLIPILGRSLISHQLSQFEKVEDLRVVVGYQAGELIREILRERKNTIFVFNHDYFHTKTGASLYLGARHANDMVIAWDGDLLVHPDDIESCLNTAGEYIGVAPVTSEDSVFVNTDGQGRVIEFSRTRGEYEWSGPACIRRDRLTPNTGHVYEQITNFLPLPTKLLRARDIDTFEDYQQAIEFVKSWESGNFRINEYYEEMSKNIKFAAETRNKSPDFSPYDIDFVKRHSNKSGSLLDLGSGTGLLVNHLTGDFANIVAVEKFRKFSDFILQSVNIRVITSDILNFSTEETFDLVTIFGVMNFFNAKEAEFIYRKVRRFLKPAGRLIVKHQMGIAEDVVVNGFSQELGTRYYSEYRAVKKEIMLLERAGFFTCRTEDIYPPEFNRWGNTHFYALVCEPKKTERL